MKTLKYIIAALAIAVAIAGCAGGSGTSNFDTEPGMSDGSIFYMEKHEEM